MSSAWIYILSHSSRQNVKVGQTKVSTESRARDYINTYQLNDFELFKAFEVNINSRKDIEKKVHEKLSNQGFRLSALDSAREIFACTPEIAERAILEAIRERDQLTEIFIQIFNSDDKFYDRRDLLADEYEPILNKFNANNKVQKLLYKFLDIDNVTIEGKKEQLYRRCKNFFINNWYYYFKKNIDLCSHTNGYYPPIHFWLYLSNLYNIIKTKRIFCENKKFEILSSWHSQIIGLLDEGYIEQNMQLINFETFNNEVDFDFIAPYLKPFGLNNVINELIIRFNKLNIIWLLEVEYLTSKIITNLENTDYSYVFDRTIGGTGAAENYDHGLHFELRSDLVRYLNFIAKHNVLHIIKNFTDKNLIRANALDSKKIR